MTRNNQIVIGGQQNKRGFIAVATCVQGFSRARIPFIKGILNKITNEFPIGPSTRDKAHVKRPKGCTGAGDCCLREYIPMHVNMRACMCVRASVRVCMRACVPMIVCGVFMGTLYQRHTNFKTRSAPRSVQRPAHVAHDPWQLVIQLRPRPTWSSEQTWAS